MLDVRLEDVATRSYCITICLLEGACRFSAILAVRRSHPDLPVRMPDIVFQSEALRAK